MINDRPTRLIVNLDALLRNYEKLNNLSDKKVGLAIVKANSYGLGSKVISKLLYENGVRHFAVATFEEALELKEVIKESLILVLGVTNPKNVKYAVENNISLTCPSKEWLEEAIKELDSITGKLKVHVKIETGMNRIGTFEEKEILEIDELLDYPKVEFEGVFSHYSNADGENNDYDDYQTANFNRLVSLFKHKPRYVHIENSAGTVKYNDRDDNYNLSRIGISLYGCYPSKNIEKLNKLGIEAHREDVFSSGEATTIYLSKKKKGAKVFLLGTKDLEDEFEKAGFELVRERNKDIDFVVLGFDTTLTYEKLWIACEYIANGVEYIATHPDFNCPLENGKFMPDAGAMMAFIKASTGKEPTVIGKPNRHIIDAIIEKYDLKKSELAMVGDRLYTDIRTGIDNGLTSILVMSGETDKKMLEETIFVPDFVFNSVKEIKETIE